LNFVGKLTEGTKNGVWTIACSGAEYSTFNYDKEGSLVPPITGETPRAAVERFVLQNQKVVIIDAVSWPDNGKCAYP
jgi:hypothetical protein